MVWLVLLPIIIQPFWYRGVLVPRIREIANNNNIISHPQTRSYHHHQPHNISNNNKKMHRLSRKSKNIRQPSSDPLLSSSSTPQHQQQQQDAPPLKEIQEYTVGFIPGSSVTSTTTTSTSVVAGRDIVDMPAFPHSREDMQLLRLVRSFTCLRDACRGYLLARKRLGITSLSDRRAEYEIKLWDKRNKMAAFLQRLVRKWIATCKVNERRQAVHRWNRYRIASEE